MPDEKNIIDNIVESHLTPKNFLFEEGEVIPVIMTDIPVPTQELFRAIRFDL
jgi:hypothetical protein